MIRYTLKLRSGLALCLEDGHLEPDSKPVEGAIRQVAINRCNGLFAGSDCGGEHQALLASLVDTWRLSDIEPPADVTDVPDRLVAGHLQSRNDELTTWRCRSAAV